MLLIQIHMKNKSLDHDVMILIFSQELVQRLCSTKSSNNHERSYRSYSLKT